jgi:hypothetical protein
LVLSAVHKESRNFCTETSRSWPSTKTRTRILLRKRHEIFLERNNAPELHNEQEAKQTFVGISETILRFSLSSFLRRSKTRFFAVSAIMSETRVEPNIVHKMKRCASSSSAKHVSVRFLVERLKGGGGKIYCVLTFRRDSISSLFLTF